MDPTINPTTPKERPSSPQPISPGDYGKSTKDFAQMVQPSKTANPAEVAAPTMPSAEEVLQRPVPHGPATPTSIQQQALHANDKAEALGAMLQKSNTRLSKADQKLIAAKLPKAHEEIRGALKQLGGDPGTKLKPAKNQSFLQKALLYLSDAQSKLGSISTISAHLKDNPNVTPSDYMLAQVKINTASQEIQFCTATISKLLDAVKTLGNIQV